mgnify:FL=1
MYARAFGKASPDRTVEIARSESGACLCFRSNGLSGTVRQRAWICPESGNGRDRICPDRVRRFPL